MKLYVIAGEASGDLHGKNLLRALKKGHDDWDFRGVGGDGMQAEGMKLTRHIRETNFMGWVEVIKNLSTIRQLFRDVKAAILEFRPDAVILIDYPGFNLRMARFLHENGIRVYYYISPQVWAWKKSRVKKIRRYVDRMLVILPFEKSFYAKEGVEVDFVGHPLLDEISNTEYQGDALKAELAPEGKQLVALLPGSRKMEIRRMLPRMLSVVKRFPEYQFIIAGAPGQDKAFYASLTEGYAVQIVMGRTYDVLDAADYALVTSGTATLETALFQVPEVVCYAGPWLSVQIARLLIQVNYISLVNLVMEREVVTELIQKDLNPERIDQELRKLMENPAHQQQLKADYQALREKLGDAGASENAAERIFELLKG